MMYTLPNTHISLPTTHILSPRFYSTSPVIPTRDSFYLPYNVTISEISFPTAVASATGQPPKIKLISAELTHKSSLKTSTRSYSKNTDAISLRALDWTMGRLELSLRQLFVSLYLWRSDALSAEQVSDVFVRLTTDFNASITMLAGYDVFMGTGGESYAFERRLREVLEPCLSGPPFFDTFEQCISGLEVVFDGILPMLTTNYMAVKQTLTVG